MLGRKRSGGLTRRKDGTPILPADLGDLAGTGRLSLGSWDEAEIRAAGFRTAAGEPGEPGMPVFSPLQRLDPTAQQDAVAAARTALLARRELVQPDPDGDAVPQHVLGLAQEIRREYHLFGQYAVSQPGTGPDGLQRTAYLVGVQTHDGRPALFEQALDPVSGQVELGLWTPDAFVAAVVGPMFVDHDELEASVLSLHLFWAAGRQRRDVTADLTRQRGAPFAGVRLREPGSPTTESGGYPAEVQGVLTGLLGAGLA